MGDLRSEWLMKSLVFRVWRVNQLGIVLVADTTYIFVAAVSIQQSASALGSLGTCRSKLKTADIAKRKQSSIDNQQSSINHQQSHSAANHPPMSLLTLNDIFSAVVERDEPRVMMHREAGRWLPIPPAQLSHKVAGVSRALTSCGM